jgi:hypothetical protein
MTWLMQCGAWWKNSESRKIVIGVYRDLQGEPFQSHDLELLRFLSPHLEHAFRLHLHLSELKARANAVHMLVTGVIFLGNDRRIVDMNTAARKLLAEGDGLMVVQRRLSAVQRIESSRLEKLICQASTTSMGKDTGTASAMRVSRRTRPPLQVLITPVRHVNLDPACPVQAMVFISDPSQLIRPGADILRALFSINSRRMPGGFIAKRWSCPSRYRRPDRG